VCFVASWTLGLPQPASTRMAQRGVMNDSEGHIGYTDDDGNPIGHMPSDAFAVPLKNDEEIKGDVQDLSAKELVKGQTVLIREMQVCANGLKSWSTDWYERSTAVFQAATFFPALIKNMQDVGVPLHQSFLYNMLMLQLALYRLGTWANSILSSPYYQLYTLTATNFAQWNADIALEMQLKRGHMGVAHAMERGKLVSINVAQAVEEAKPKAKPLEELGGDAKALMAKNPWLVPRAPSSALNGKNAAEPGDLFNAFVPTAPLLAAMTKGATRPKPPPKGALVEAPEEEAAEQEAAEQEAADEEAAEQEAAEQEAAEQEAADEDDDDEDDDEGEGEDDEDDDDDDDDEGPLK